MPNLDDPLADRIGKRTRAEDTRKEYRQAFWQGAFAGGRSEGGGFLLLPVLLLLCALWAVVSAVYEEGAHLLRRDKHKRRV